MDKMFWNDWRGQPQGETYFVPFEKATMLIRRLFSWRRWNIDLHCFVGGDAPGCFHTHPSWAFRIVLWGGYIEELESGEIKHWFPLRFGFMPPSYSHRVVTPIYDRSYSLWIRSPKKHKVELRGDGWGPFR